MYPFMRNFSSGVVGLVLLRCDGFYTTETRVNVLESREKRGGEKMTKFI